MNTTQHEPLDNDSPGHAAVKLPAPHIKKMRWPFPIIWIIPLIAIIASAYYLYRHKTEHGQPIDITFSNANDLKVEDTPVVVHGVHVGRVKSITLSDDQKHAVVHVDLKEGASKAANRGTKFWVVRPDVAGGSIMGLSTLISGPYIEALPGEGPVSSEFSGLDEPPVLIGDGMRVVLSTDRLEHLQVNSGVYFRGIQVGAVQDIRLSDDSSQVNATIVIWARFTQLLRSTSKFWMLSGADVKGGIFSGVQVQVNSLRNLIAGGVTFATPDGGDPAADGMIFGLYPEPDKKWLQWNPRIKIDQPVFDSNAQESEQKAANMPKMK